MDGINWIRLIGAITLLIVVFVSVFDKDDRLFRFVLLIILFEIFIMGSV